MFFLQCNPLDPAVPKGKQLGPDPPSATGGDVHHTEHSGLSGELHGRHQPGALGHCLEGNPDTQAARQETD